MLMPDSVTFKVSFLDSVLPICNYRPIAKQLTRLIKCKVTIKKYF